MIYLAQISLILWYFFKLLEIFGMFISFCSAFLKEHILTFLMQIFLMHLICSSFETQTLTFIYLMSLFCDAGSKYCNWLAVNIFALSDTWLDFCVLDYACLWLHLLCSGMLLLKSTVSVEDGFFSALTNFLLCTVQFH